MNLMSALIHCRFEPLDVDESFQWRNWLVNKELKKDYLHPSDFTDLMKTVNNKPGFDAYKIYLTKPSAEEYLEGITHGKKSDKDAVYWHLSAPLDLRPDVPKEMIINPFELHEGDAVSFKNIADKIRQGVTKYWFVFYYDKYIITEWQQRKAAILFGAFENSKFYIITYTDDNNRYEFIKNNQKHITEINIKDVFKQNKEQHDRYFILAENERLENWNVWNITNSLDFIQFEENEKESFTADTNGKIIQSVVFTKVKPEILHTELRNFIQSLLPAFLE